MALTPSDKADTKAALGMAKAWTGEAGATMTEFSKIFSDMKMPQAPDVDALLASHKRNLEVLSAANRVALEGAQTVARRHLEIIQQTAAEITETMKTLSSAEAPAAKAAKQAELLKTTYEHAVSNIKEISDLIQKANGEAVGLLNKRFSEAVDEWKLMIEKSGPKG